MAKPPSGFTGTVFAVGTPYMSSARICFGALPVNFKVACTGSSSSGGPPFASNFFPSGLYCVPVCLSCASAVMRMCFDCASGWSSSGVKMSWWKAERCQM